MKGVKSTVHFCCLLVVSLLLHRVQLASLAVALFRNLLRLAHLLGKLVIGAGPKLLLLNSRESFVRLLSLLALVLQVVLVKICPSLVPLLGYLVRRSHFFGEMLVRDAALLFLNRRERFVRLLSLPALIDRIILVKTRTSLVPLLGYLV